MTRFMLAGRAKKTKAKAKGKGAAYYLSRDWQLYLLLFLPVAYYIIFKYIPMYGIVIAFQDFNLFEGVFGSEWIGLEVFKEIFKMQSFYIVLRNTLMLNLLDLLVSFPAPVILAIMLSEVRMAWFKKTAQAILYIPHFISWIIVGGMAYQILSTHSGLVNSVITSLGLEPVPFLTDKWWWLLTYVLTGVWHSAGWGTILYLAAITGIPPELYEAAKIDGAGRMRRILHITMPGIKPTIVVLLIMKLGWIVAIGFDRPFVMGNRLVEDFSEVISTFVYSIGLQSGRFNIATAIGLFQAVVGLLLIVVSDRIAKKLGEQGIW